MKMTPRNKHIAIQRIDADERTPGGLFLPDETIRKAKPQRGIVMAICEPFTDDNGREWKSGYLPGDKVFFAKYIGEELTLPDRSVIVFMKEIDILAAGRDEPDADVSLSFSPGASASSSLDDASFAADPVQADDRPAFAQHANGNGMSIVAPAQPVRQGLLGRLIGRGSR